MSISLNNHIRMKKFRILSIDGGGVKGAFPASFLSYVEQNIQGDLWEYFDLIVGTSTGGIIALGLGLGLPASEILKFYTNAGPVIFPGGMYNRLRLWTRHWWKSKYDSTALTNALKEMLKDARIGDSKTRLMIPSLNLETGEVHVYKTRHAPRLLMDYKELMVDVALATAAAPTYFPTHNSAHGLPLVDGGMWANNPSGFAVVEAISVLGAPSDSIHLLSLGCTEAPLSTTRAQRLKKGKFYWASKIVDVFMTGQSSASMGMAILLTGRDMDRILRVSPSVATGRFSLDEASDIDVLSGLGHSEARKALPKLQEMFFDTKTEPFVPNPMP